MDANQLALELSNELRTTDDPQEIIEITLPILMGYLGVNTQYMTYLLPGTSVNFIMNYENGDVYFIEVLFNNMLSKNICLVNVNEEYIRRKLEEFDTMIGALIDYGAEQESILRLVRAKSMWESLIMGIEIDYSVPEEGEPVGA